MNEATAEPIKWKMTTLVTVSLSNLMFHPVDRIFIMSWPQAHATIYGDLYKYVFICSEIAVRARAFRIHLNHRLGDRSVSF